MFCVDLLPFVVGDLMPPRFELDLSLLPQRRWSGALDLVLDTHGFDNSFGPAFKFHNDSLFSYLTAEQFTELAAALTTHFPETATELHSLAKDFHARGHLVTFEYLAAWTYYHELGKSYHPSSRYHGIYYAH